MTLKNLIIAIVLGTALAAGIFVASEMNRPAKLRTAFVLPTPSDLPDFSLHDQFGEAVNADTFRGQWDLVFFGFTNCPDICPATLQILASARRELVQAGVATPPRIVLVSVDPERDTAADLERYMNYFGEGNLGVTGKLEEISKLTSALGIYFQKASGDNDNYSVDHSAAVLVINANGDFSALFSAPHDVPGFVHDLPIIMDRG